MENLEIDIVIPTVDISISGELARGTLSRESFW